MKHPRDKTDKIVKQDFRVSQIRNFWMTRIHLFKTESFELSTLLTATVLTAAKPVA
jgi:hypothetical protein